MESEDEVLQLVSEEESDEESVGEDANAFDYVLVKRSQLEAILSRRCVRCGRAKYERSTPSKRPRLSDHARKVIWKQKGASMTAMLTCSCYKKGKKYIRWPAQAYIKGKKTCQGNVAVVAAAAASPVDYPQLRAFSRALNMPSMGRRVFDRYKHRWVDPAIAEMYEEQKGKAIQAASKPLWIAMDGQYDSRGYSAEMCCVLAMDEATKRILTFPVVEKNEFGGISQGMEKHGTKRVVEELQELGLEIGSVTIDKLTNCSTSSLLFILLTK